MKKECHFLFLFVGLLVLSGCSDEHFENMTIASHEFKLKKNSITVDYTASFENIYLDTDMAISWTTSSSADRLSVSPSSGIGGANINVKWQENTAAYDREATVTITTPQRSDLTLTVKQGRSEEHTSELQSR